MYMFESFDTDMLDDTLWYNKRIHKSPLTYLQEVLMYEYDMNDIMECGYNFKDIAVSECDDGISNTLCYYVDRLSSLGCPQKQIESILNEIREKRYSIFYIDKRLQLIYLVSLDPFSNTEICIDPSMNYFKSNPTTGNAGEIWSDMISEMTFDNFRNKIYTDYSESCNNVGEIWDLIQSNDEYMSRVGIRPCHAIESVDFDNYDNDFIIGQSLSPATEARKTKSPEEKVEDGLSELEKMSNGEDNANTGSNVIDNTKEARDNDSNVIDAAKATSDKLEQDGQDSPDDMGDTETGESDNDNEPDDTDDTTDEENPEEDDMEEDDDSTDDTESPEDALHDPDAKRKYHLKLKKLYKYINDSIDALGAFTPAYNFDFVSNYYEIQNDFARLRDAIFKICTEKIDSMDVVDLMNKYASACMTYDSLLAMLREFVDKYKKERDKSNKKTTKSRS